MPRGQPFPAGEHKAAMNKREGMTNTQHKQHKMIHKRSISKIILLDGLNQLQGTNLILSSDVEQDTYMFGLHKRPLTYLCIIS